MWEDWIKDIKAKKLKPIYFLMGDEDYFIDLITNSIDQEVLTEEEKAFNQLVVYASEHKPTEILARAAQYPMGAAHNVIIVKEAQNWSRQHDALADYAENPVPHTVLCLAYKSDKFDKRKKLYKALKKQGAIFESKKLYDNKLPGFIESLVKKNHLNIEPLATQLMAENIGNNLGRLANEVVKMKSILGKDATITPAEIEAHVGISRDFNTFELTKAVGERNQVKALTIAQYFAENPKAHPLVVTISALGGYFTKLLIYHSLIDKSPKSVASALGINPFFAKEYAIAARNFPIKKIAPIISLIRDADVKSKGIGATHHTEEGEHLRELLLKVFLV